MIPFLDLQPQYRSIQSELDDAVHEVIASQRFILGPPVERLEAELAGRVGVPHAIGCASGTDAILLALKALDLPPGSGVLVPAFTFFATAGAVWNAGLRPVFVDVDEATFNVTAETLERALVPDVRAMIPVHLYGQMAGMPEIMELARAHELAVIEDAAQSIDAQQEVDGAWRAAGALGTFGAFSFFPSKNLGGYGDGGLITTADDELAERVRKLRVHGGHKMYHHDLVGTNSRLDALQAAVLSAKLKHLDAWTEKRRANARVYDDAFAELPGVIAPPVRDGNRHVYNQYTLRVSESESGKAHSHSHSHSHTHSHFHPRDALQAHLQEQGIGHAIYYPLPLHLQACFAGLGYRVGDFPVSERLAREVLSLPIFPELTADQLGGVVDGVTSLFRG